MASTLISDPVRQRALVVEPDLERRQRLTRLLRDQGLEVVECADVVQGRKLFADQRLVMAPLNGDNAAMKEFVAWVRAEAGVSQPWIIALGEQHELAAGETPAHYGVNDLLTGPMNTGTLVERLESLGLGRPVRALPPAPPSYQRMRRAAPAAPARDTPSAPTLIEHFPAAVAILDRNMTYLSVNARWMKEFQIPSASLTGCRHYDVFPDLHPDWRSLYERGLAGDLKQTTDDVMVRPDGTESLVHWEIQPWHEPSGAVGGLVLTCAALDAVAAGRGVVAEPPVVVAAAADSFREMAEAAPFGMILLDDEARVLYANPQHKAVLGFAAELKESIEAWLQRACSGDEVFQKRALDEWWESVWRRRTPLTCSLRNLDGLLKDIEFRPAALSGDRLLLTVFDVTDARLDEQAVRTSEARYRGLFQHASAALMMINPAGNLTEVNPAFESLTGWPRQEARRAVLTDFLPAEAIARLRAASLAGGAAGGFSTTLRHRHGPPTPVHLSGAVIRNDQGQPAFTACLLVPLPETPARTPWEAITPDWLFLLDAGGTILEHSTPRDFAGQLPAGKSLAGEVLETSLPELTAPLPLDVMMERLLDSPGQETRCEFVVHLPEHPLPRRVEARLLLMPGDGPSRFGLTLRDVTRARSAASPGGFNATLLEHLQTPAILTTERGRMLHLNPAAEALAGYVTAELKDGGLYRLFRPDAPKEFSAELSHQLQAHRSWHTPATLTSKDGTLTPGQIELTPAFDESSGARGFILLFRPLPPQASELPAAPEIAPEAPAPRPAISLHRARNDLQILASLLALQAEHGSDPAIRAALLASRDRLAAVALLYRLIQHGEDGVDFARYTQEIARTLLEAHQRPAGGPAIETLFSGIVLPQRCAIALGLILGELLTSSLTWSFPDPESRGHIRVTLSINEGGGVLILRDNGRVLEGDLRAQREAGFPHRLIQLLASQISGQLTWLSALENEVRLRFVIPQD